MGAMALYLFTSVKRPHGHLLAMGWQKRGNDQVIMRSLLRRSQTPLAQAAGPLRATVGARWMTSRAGITGGAGLACSANLTKTLGSVDKAP